MLRGKKHKKKKISKKALIIMGAVLLFLIIIAVVPTGDNDTAKPEKKIAMPNVVNLTAEDAMAKIKKDGFDSIELENKNGDSIDDNDSVEYIVVSQKPKATKKYGESKTITLTCNSIEKSLNGLTYPKAKHIIKNIKYKAKYLHSITKTDFTKVISSYSNKEASKWLVTKIGKIDYQKKTVKVYIDSKVNIARQKKAAAAEKELEKRLSPSTALTAVQRYGKDNYPYGFKLHMFSGKIAERALNSKTLFMKYTATITNAYGTEADVTCEAKVTGTTDNPEVVDFVIY